MNNLKAPVTENDHIQGDKEAPITLIEYGDFECPYCAAAHGQLVEIQKEFPKIIQLCFRHFPLTQVHPYAELAAEATEFAAEHNKFWEMHDKIFENQDELSEEYVLETAEELGLDSKELFKALQQGKYRAKVKEQFMSGVKSGVNATPTIFINEQRYDGPVDELVEVIRELGL